MQGRGAAYNIKSDDRAVRDGRDTVEVGSVPKAGDGNVGVGYSGAVEVHDAYS